MEITTLRDLDYMYLASLLLAHATMRFQQYKQYRWRWGGSGGPQCNISIQDASRNKSVVM